MEGVIKSWAKQRQEEYDKEDMKSGRESMEVKDWRPGLWLGWRVGEESHLPGQVKDKIRVKKMSPVFKYSFQGTCGTSADNVQEERWGESSEGRAIFHRHVRGNGIHSDREVWRDWTQTADRARQVTCLLFSYLHIRYNENHKGYIIFPGGKECNTRLKPL